MASTIHETSQAVMGSGAIAAGTLEQEIRNDSENLVVGDFRINLYQRTVSVRDKKIELAPAEFELLMFLISHPKRMVTPQTMLSTHWTGNRVHQTQFLRVLLSLRKKLEAAGAGLHYIRTEPMVVYRFDPLG